MRRLLLSLLLILCTAALIGCADARENTETWGIPNTDPEYVITTEYSGNTTEAEPDLQESEPETTEQLVTEPTQTEPEATEPEDTEPTPTEPEETVPKETKPEATEPEPTQPSEPEVTEPSETKPDKQENVDPSPLLSGWIDRNGKRYYRHENGDLQRGWLVLDGERYYFDEDYAMVVGCVDIPEYGKTYFDTTGKEVILANPWNYIPDQYTVKLGEYSGYSMAKHIVSPLKQMLADCKAAGYTAIVCSAYRSHNDQIYLHNRRIQRFLDQGYSEEDAKREAARRVAVPGTSEHELGLALDIVDINYQNLDEKQETMPAQKWLMANSWKYGFVLRYPNQKSDITGIIYEPWHYRYVGVELAKELYESGMCLEEYLSTLPVQ